MKKKAFLMILILGAVIFFIYKGIPVLKELRDNPTEFRFTSDSGENITGRRGVQMNISVESMCMNMISGAQYVKCNKENCDGTCKSDGCKFFGLIYSSSDYTPGSCVCNCLEENKIKKALTQS